MGQSLDICSNGRAEDNNGTPIQPNQGSSKLDSQNITAEFSSIMNKKKNTRKNRKRNNQKTNNSPPRNNRTHRHRSPSPSRRRNWSSREKQLDQLRSTLSKKNSDATKTNLILTRSQGSMEYSSPKTRSRRHARAASSLCSIGTASDVSTFHQEQSLQQSLCNPNIKSNEILQKFEFLSVEERGVLYDLYLSRKSMIVQVESQNVLNRPEKSKSLSQMEQQYILGKISNISLFSSFQQHELTQLMLEFTKVAIPSGNKIIIEHDVKDRRYFLIKSGRFEIRKGSTVLAQVGPGVGIGELALYISGRARGASVIALESAEVYVLTPASFWEVTANSLAALKDRAKRAVEKTKFCEMFGHDTNAIEEISKKLFFKRFRTGDCILRKGHVGNAYYILVEGSVVIRGDHNDHRRKLTCSVEFNGIEQPGSMTHEKGKWKRHCVLIGHCMHSLAETLDTKPYFFSPPPKKHASHICTCSQRNVDKCFDSRKRDHRRTRRGR